MKRYACIFLLFHFLYFVHSDDMATIKALSKNLPPSSSGKKWNITDTNPCSGEGVTCKSLKSQQVITHLNLSRFGLTTSNTANSTIAFFQILCKLDSLQSLNLSMNFLSYIPASSFLSNCTGFSQLKSLDLSSNLLNGDIYNFSSFRNLQLLDLSDNKFTGEVTTKLGELNKIRSLNLSSNKLTGTIPLISSLEELELSDNIFTGKIPSGISKLKNLTFLSLSINALSGSIPNEIRELSNLKTLLLSSNNLTEVPSNLSSMKNLTWFAANQNKFTGVIPAGITRNLKNLDLSYNNLSGLLPLDLFSYPNLESIDLSSNKLQGTIPGNISKSLFRLRLGGNNLTGMIPTTFQQPTRLTYLELDNNELNGEIPVQLEKCENLTLLNLASNKLQGTLPKELGNLSKLVILKLQENKISGEIPSELSKLGKLITLNLSQNSLNGQIPYAIFNLSTLQTLNLEGNQLSGSIPSSIINLNYLIELQLGSNKLTGTVPRMPKSYTTTLNLSSNYFSGSIPSHLADLNQLEILDLSYNNFSGLVPSSLIQLKSLTLLVLSHNKLSGTLPKFPPYVDVIFTNTGLVNCSSVNCSSEPCPLNAKKKSHTFIEIVSIISAIIGVGLVATVIFLVISKRVDRVEDESLKQEEQPPQITNFCYMTSNSLHRSNIDFAKAIEVAGNQCNVMFKTRFCTYYKIVMPRGMTYSVKKLNLSDKIFHMGSNERFDKEMQTLGKLSNSNVMVPLAYVLTQDSAFLFYEHVHKGTIYDFLHKGLENSLDWQSRYCIALGIAQGITFLHGCTQPVLLLDLSTRSVHLKSIKEPQIGDIELCKVIDPSKSIGSLSTVAGSVGYIPPEYAYTMRVTASGNVYSFGVILLELLTGRPPVSNGIELAKWALNFSSKPDEGENILDSRVYNASTSVKRQMLSVLKVAKSCVSLSPESRPKMRYVLRMLFNAR